MQIKRDYSHPFFREPKRHRLRNSLIAALLGLLLGLAVVSRWTEVEQVLGNLSGVPMTPTPQPSALARRGAALAHNGDFEAAELLLAAAVEERPDNSAYLYELGKVQIELGDYQGALMNAEAITDRDANDARGFALRAAALTWQGNAKEAIPVGLSALELDPSFISLYATLSRAYIDEQRWGEGLDIAERGMSLDGDNAELVRAYAYALQSVGAYDEAAAHLERAIGLRPGHLPPQFELAALYLARDNAQRAIDLYDRILSLDTRNARAMLRQCLAYLQVGQAERALGFCEDAVTNAPEDAESLFHLALLYYSESRFAESLDLFQRCLENDEGRFDLSCRFRLGLSHYYTGDCASGWALLQESMAIATAGSGYEATIDNIQQGLDAILSDPACIESAAATVSFQD